MVLSIFYQISWVGIETFTYKGKDYNDLRKNINSNIEVKVKFIQKGSIKKGDEKY